MGLLDFVMPPQQCHAPIDLPENLEGILPPVATPPADAATPTREDLKAASAAAAAAIAKSLRKDEECQECEPCKAVAAGSEHLRAYGNTRTNRVGYEYQHHIVDWFVHDPVGRHIMEWRMPAPQRPNKNDFVDFDGLDPDEGNKLAIRAITRAEYDPTYTSHCYLIEAKYGYDWFRWDPKKEKWKLAKPAFLVSSLRDEIVSQNLSFSPHYPNVALVWIFSNRNFKAWADENLIGLTNSVGIRPVYYPYIASEDRS